ARQCTTLPRNAAHDLHGNAALRASPSAAGVRAVHVLPQAAVPGMRDAVGRHLALREVPRRQAPRRQAALARGGVDLRGGRRAAAAFPERARAGVGGGADRGTGLIRAPLSTTSLLDRPTALPALTATPGPP